MTDAEKAGIIREWQQNAEILRKRALRQRYTHADWLHDLHTEARSLTATKQARKSR